MPQEGEPISEWRTWTDDTGNHQVEAKFLRITGSAIVLKKKDGTEVTLDLNRLSSLDREWVQSAVKSGSAKPLTLGRLRSQEQSILYANKIMEAYQIFLTQSDLTSSDRILVEKRIKELEPEAARNALLINGKFRLKEELDDMKLKANAMVDDAIARINELEKKDTVRILNEASRMDPVSCRPDMLLALGYSMGVRNYEFAEKHFQECEERLNKFGELMSDQLDSAKQAVLNNLAIVQIRMGYLDRACATWDRAIGVTGTLPEPLLGNFVHELKFINAAKATDGKLFFDNPKADLVRRYKKLADRAGVTETAISNHRQSGWHYLAIDLTERNPDLDRMNLGMVDQACLMCDGTSFATCQRCGGDGKVLGKRMSSRSHPSGQTQYFEESVMQQCSNCSGDGRFDCPGCSSGIEQIREPE